MCRLISLDPGGLDISHLQEVKEAGGTLRPRNVELGRSNLELLGISYQTEFRRGIREELSGFLWPGSVILSSNIFTWNREQKGNEYNLIHFNSVLLKTLDFLWHLTLEAHPPSLTSQYHIMLQLVIVKAVGRHHHNWYLLQRLENGNNRNKEEIICRYLIIWPQETGQRTRTLVKYQQNQRKFLIFFPPEREKEAWYCQ